MNHSLKYFHLSFSRGAKFLRRIILCLALGSLLIVFTGNVIALEKLRGTVRENPFSHCTNQCDLYYLVPDSGYPQMSLRHDPTTQIQISQYLDNHVEILGFRGTCGGCEVMFVSYITRLTTADVGLSEEPLPGQSLLEQNYPNPFNPTTQIRFQVPSSGFVSLNIYDMLGRKITTLLEEKLTAGAYTVSWDGNDRASGLYYTVLRVLPMNGVPSVQVRKMLLLK